MIVIRRPIRVATKAAKKLGLLGCGSGELLDRAFRVETPGDCAAILIDCLAALGEGESRSATRAANAELLTVRQAAGRFNIGERTLYRLLQKGDLQNYGPGTSKRIKPADLENYLERLAQPATAPTSLFG